GRRRREPVENTAKGGFNGAGLRNFMNFWQWYGHQGPPRSSSPPPQKNTRRKSRNDDLIQKPSHDGSRLSRRPSQSETTTNDELKRRGSEPHDQPAVSAAGEAASVVTNSRMHSEGMRIFNPLQQRNQHQSSQGRCVHGPNAVIVLFARKEAALGQFDISSSFSSVNSLSALIAVHRQQHQPLPSPRSS
ncbi:hypothetical protein KC331_g6280, partial [Hortaea werneckii]